MASFYVKLGDDESTDEPVVVDSEEWSALGVSDGTLLWAEHLPDCAFGRGTFRWACVSAQHRADFDGCVCASRRVLVGGAARDGVRDVRRGQRTRHGSLHHTDV